MSVWFIVLFVMGVVAVVLGVTLACHRELSDREIDDVHPDIPCNDYMLSDSTWLWVIPLYGDKPLTSNPEWVDRLKRSGKKLGMHGVRHTYSEFATDVSREYIQRGMDEFEKAFGYKPTHFKPPKMQITANNIKLLHELGFTVHNRWQQLIHKVYHCQDHGRTDKGRLRYELERTENQRTN
jgi:predicted deacetylase